MEINKSRYIKYIAMLLTLVMVFTMLPVSVGATETVGESGDASVEVYLSISHDAEFVKTSKGHVMSFKKMTVPYFDLANYDLVQFYFVSERYGKGENVETDAEGNVKNPSSDLKPGTSEHAEGKVTMLHALIYATEVYYLGVKPEDAGQGQLKMMGKIGSADFNPTGSVGSLYFTNLWGMDENLNYYHNYQYPLASEGWGSTADQILLHNGDIITLGHFTDYGFHKDPLSIFNLIKAGEDTVVKEVVQGEKVDLTVYLAGKGENYTTKHSPRGAGITVDYIPLSKLSYGNVASWYYLDETNSQGKITVDTASMEPGEYLVCVGGQCGGELTEAIVSTPGGIILKVTEPKNPGDVNDDGKMSIKDVINLRKYLIDNTHVINTSNSDLNGDGKITIKDVIQLRKALLK